jgi:hypothetical protein
MKSKSLLHHPPLNSGYPWRERRITLLLMAWYKAFNKERAGKGSLLIDHPLSQMMEKD